MDSIQSPPPGHATCKTQEMLVSSLAPTGEFNDVELSETSWHHLATSWVIAATSYKTPRSESPIHFSLCRQSSLPGSPLADLAFKWSSKEEHSCRAYEIAQQEGQLPGLSGCDGGKDQPVARCPNGCWVVSTCPHEAVLPQWTH